jgi:hypothetical protein
MYKEEIEEAAQIRRRYVRATRGLREKGYIRSFKSPPSDFSEWLVKVAPDGDLPENKSQHGYDVVAGKRRIQVKSIARAPSNTINGYIIQRKDKDNDLRTGATHYAFVVFDDLMPHAIYLVPENFVRNFPKKQIRRSDLAANGRFRINIDLSAFKVKTTASRQGQSSDFPSVGNCR